MREIKFRAWDNHKNCYVDIRHIDFTLNGLSVYSRPVKSNRYAKMDSFVLEQYTGLKDKNGKEIYEGDIVYSEHFGQTEEIKWMGNGFWINNGNQGIHLPSVLKIIGNIHENPDLLPKGNNHEYSALMAVADVLPTKGEIIKLLNSR